MDEEIYRSLFENSCLIMLIIHPGTGNIMDANNVACNYYGYSKDELLSMRIQDINMLSEAQVFEEMENAKTEKRNFFKFQHRLGDGSVRDVEVFCSPITIQNEKVLYSIIHDITERKQMEYQILNEQRFSESLINSLPGVLYVFDQLGHLKRWNKNLETVTGYSSDQIKRMNPIDLVAIEDKDRVRATITAIFSEGSADVVAGLSTSSGEIIPFLFTGYRFVQHGLNYLVGVGLNISDRVKIEKEKECLIAKLQAALHQVKQLSGFLPICASCKKIRDDKGYWNQIESYIKQHSEVEFSHSLCPDCAKKIYHDLTENDTECSDPVP